MAESRLKKLKYDDIDVGDWIEITKQRVIQTTKLFAVFFSHVFLRLAEWFGKVFCTSFN